MDDYRAELDMETLLWTRGKEFALSRLESRLRCPMCGSRDLVLMFVVPSERQINQKKFDGAVRIENNEVTLPALSAADYFYDPVKFYSIAPTQRATSEAGNGLMEKRALNGETS